MGQTRPSLDQSGRRGRTEATSGASGEGDTQMAHQAMLGASGMRPGPRSRGVQPGRRPPGPCSLLSLAEGVWSPCREWPLHPAGPVCSESSSGDGELTTLTPHPAPTATPGAPLQPTIPGAHSPRRSGRT